MCRSAATINEAAWWAKVQISPMAKGLWTVTLFQKGLRTPATRDRGNRSGLAGGLVASVETLNRA
jgi:hypothetical protein